MKIFLDVLGVVLSFFVLLVAVIIAKETDNARKWDNIYNKRGRDNE